MASSQENWDCLANAANEVVNLLLFNTSDIIERQKHVYLLLARNAQGTVFPKTFPKTVLAHRELEDPDGPGVGGLSSAHLWAVLGHSSPVVVLYPLVRWAKYYVDEFPPSQ